MIDPRNDSEAAAHPSSRLSEEDQKLLTEAERLRAGGMLRFILLRGVLGFGGIMTIAMTIFRLVDTRTHWASPIWHGFIIFPIGGFVVGLALWIVIEIKYRLVIKKWDSPFRRRAQYRTCNYGLASSTVTVR